MSIFYPYLSKLSIIVMKKIVGNDKLKLKLLWSRNILMGILYMFLLILLSSLLRPNLCDNIDNIFNIISQSDIIGNIVRILQVNEVFFY